MTVVTDRIYCGPVDTLDRFRSGEIVTRTDLLTDHSLWTVEPMDPAAAKRLRWMLVNLVTDAGRIVRHRG